MPPRYLNPDSRWLLALLAALVALGPLSVDMYLPAMPSMMQTLGTDINHMHLTLSTYLAGFAIFHLACGPLADRYGRKPVLIAGTILFVGACIGCASSSTVEELLLYRFIQGIGACVGPTLARAVTRDIFGPTRAARALSLIAMLMALAPAIAPTLGGILLLWLPWQTVFIFLGLYGISMIAIIYIFLAESLPVRQSLHPVTIARNYSQLCRHSVFMIAAFASGLIYAGLMTYLACSSFVYINMFGVPVQYFGFIFLTSVAGYMLGSAISARLASSYELEQTVLIGASLTAGACAIMWVGGSLLPGNIWVLILPMIFYATGMGLVLPNSMAIALRPFAQMAGTASALLGFIQMSISSAATVMIGKFLIDTPAPMFNFMLGITLCALALSILLYRTNRNAKA